MPTRPPTHRAPHLPTLEQARAAYDRQRGSAAVRGYDAAWRDLRDAVLRAEPHCRMCRDEGRLTPAAMVDHIRPVRTHPALRLAISNLRPLCLPCHGRRHAAGRGEYNPR